MTLPLSQQITRLLRNNDQCPSGNKPPLTADQITALLNEDIDLVRVKISQLVERRAIHNVGTNRHGLYRHGPPARPQMPPPRFRPEGNYTGQAPIPLRPGAMDGYDLPSRRGDRLVSYTVPMLMGSSVKGGA